ncbi:MAG: trimeric intracellular cation channel family protein [Spirochaetaceae bacterium]|nr:trimeric intracellular cation channel family protein [Spirochaetaceae bacterium]
MDNIDNLIYGFDIFGTIVFAFTGGLKGVQLKFDFLGVIVFSVIVGCGGGMIRDSLIGATPVAALTNWVYLALCIIVGIIVFFIGNYIESERKVIKYSDAIGLGVFTAIGTAKALLFSCSPIGAVLCGVITATGGGILRDLMSKEIPNILKSDIYATASLLGGLLYLFLIDFGYSAGKCFFITSAFVFILRAIVLKYSLQLPQSGYKDKKHSK